MAGTAVDQLKTSLHSNTGTYGRLCVTQICLVKMKGLIKKTCSSCEGCQRWSLETRVVSSLVVFMRSRVHVYRD